MTATGFFFLKAGVRNFASSARKKLLPVLIRG